MASNSTGAPSIKRDIAEMQVAMDAPDEAARAALDQERPDAPVGSRLALRQRRHLGGREQLGRLAELAVMLVDIGPHGLDPGRGREPAAPAHARPPRCGRAVGERGVDAAGIRQMIERERLVEAAHLDRPFDRLALPVERERAVRRRA